MKLLSATHIIYIAFTCAVGVPTEKLRTEEVNRFENMTFNFDCSDKAVGFYADQEYNCQIFHMCDEEGQRIPHSCANETSFNQEYRICDWQYNFECSEAHNWFYLNELTYATDPPTELDNT